MVITALSFQNDQKTNPSSPPAGVFRPFSTGQKTNILPLTSAFVSTAQRSESKLLTASTFESQTTIIHHLRNQEILPTSFISVFKPTAAVTQAISSYRIQPNQDKQRLTETHRDSERLRETQRDSERLRETQRDSERLTETQRDASWRGGTCSERRRRPEEEEVTSHRS